MFGRNFRHRDQLLYSIAARDGAKCNFSYPVFGLQNQAKFDLIWFH